MKTANHSLAGRRHARVLIPIFLLTGLTIAGCAGGPENMLAQPGPDGSFILSPCPGTPNCVSTFATDEQHAIEPLAFQGSAEETMAALVSVVENMVRTTIISQQANYLHVEYRTRIGFVDDVEFVLDEERSVVHFRSASRVGASDLGLNRTRMEEFRALYNGPT